MDSDKFKLDRTAQFLYVEAQTGAGSPPRFGSQWLPLYACKVEVIEHNISAPHTAVLWFPALRWDQSSGLRFGDRIRIKTAAGIVIFSGFVTRADAGFFGGDDNQKAWERNAVYCQSHLWLLSTISPVYGQLARSADNYTDFGQSTQAPITNSFTEFNGRRCIFNQDGNPNRDVQFLDIAAGPNRYPTASLPLFADPDHNTSWTALNILNYLLSPINNYAYHYLPIVDPAELLGLNHPDWSQVINHLVCDGLSTLAALAQLCQKLGWDFREDYDSSGAPTVVFFKIAAAAGYTRTISRTAGVVDQTTILHQLHAPAVGSSIDTPVAAGAKMLWAAEMVKDIATVVNTPVVLGGIQLFEFTAELVPAWNDDNLTPDTDTPYLAEADLQFETSPNDYTFYQYYHPRGSGFKHNIGRRWRLNEGGRQTGGAAARDRGAPLDFSTILPLEYVQSTEGQRLFGPFNRRLLPCLTVDKDDYNSVGIKVEFSFDAGISWQVIPCVISSLGDECGINIDQANLAEIVGQNEEYISGGDLDGVQLNYWTSLCDDKLNSRSFKDGNWNTRIRVTASVQMDQRLFQWPDPSNTSGSPFNQTRIYDFSDRFGFAQRAVSSIHHDSDLPAAEIDATDVFNQQIDRLRNANQDTSISGQYTLDRLWLDDGNGCPDFAVGDALEKIAGREVSLKSSFAGGPVYPEIVKIIYYPQKQQQKLITRDHRFAEMSL